MSENKQHPHAALIAQLARDALNTDRPQDWYQKRPFIDWIPCAVGNSGDMPTFNKNVPHRRIPQWVIDGLKVGEKINVGNDPYVYQISDFESNGFEDYAIITHCAGTKLKFFKSDVGFKKYETTRTMKINGFEVPEPLKTIQANDVFYYPCFEGRVCRANFSVMDNKHVYLKNMGMCHSTHEAAEIHSKAMDSFRLKGGE